MDVETSADGRPIGALPAGYARHKGPPEPRPVWVHLAHLHPSPADAPAPPDSGELPSEGGRPRSRGAPIGQHGRLDITGEVIGLLHHWERDTTGRWFGVVDYRIPLREDFRPAIAVTLGLVPAVALRPRDLTTGPHSPR